MRSVRIAHREKPNCYNIAFGDGAIESYRYVCYGINHCTPINASRMAEKKNKVQIRISHLIFKKVVVFLFLWTKINILMLHHAEILKGICSRPLRSKQTERKRKRCRFRFWCGLTHWSPHNPLNLILLSLQWVQKRFFRLYWMYVYSSLSLSLSLSLL